jgi:hypothetical protein
LAFVLTVSAQKVALHSASGIQHFTGVSALVNAYTASNAGDTIYLPGGGFTPPGSFDKMLRIYGAGHYPDSTVATAKTYINSSFSLTDNADGFYLEGVDINGTVTFTYNVPVDNVIIKYCRMINLEVVGDNTFSTPSTNLTFINNVVTGVVSFSNAQNAGFFNNMIENRVISSVGNLFENNIFMYSYTGFTGYYSIHGDNNIVNNNIFLNASSRHIAGTSNQGNNNIFVVAPGLGTTPMVSGNYSPIAQVDIFVSQTGNTFSYDDNYHLQAPATYLGLDNTEVGLYGGVHGYKEGAVPSNPHIQFKNISATTTPNGLLNVQVKAAAQDH